MRYGMSIALILAVHVAVADPSPDAAQLYRGGQAAYDQARYDDALEAWQRSFDLSHAPGLLYNIAQAYRLRARPGDCTSARDHYQQFVALVPPSPQRELAEQYIRELGACTILGTVATHAIIPTANSNDDRLRTRELEVGAIGVIGIGFLATGIALGHHASTLGDQVTTACSVSCDWSTEKSTDAAGHRDSSLGWTFGTLGAVILVGDAALYYFGIREHNVAINVAASSAAITWSGTW
jgi:tetratricopeptide (TPR) repeat protein